MWMQYAADRCRFKRHVYNFDRSFGYIFSDTHRNNIRTLIDEQLAVNIVADNVAALVL
jgi:hypothetical protein